MNICFVHAHPDDETLATGALIAHLGQEGHQVFVLTATRGEMGDVVPGPLSPLAGTPELELRREQELAGALEVLGVTGSAFLGSDTARAILPSRRYLDSGMRWVTPEVAGPAEHADEASLSAADHTEVAADIAAYLRHIDAELAISYDVDGGYGHPDHVAMHHATRRAASQVGIGFAVISPEPGDGVHWYALEDLLPVVVEALGHHQTQLSVHGTTLTHSGGQPDVVRTSVGLKGDLPG
ncbi:PIG-L family deacetylase [Tessaracoccus antarcticus]|uniref:GlcNAc-PI de-N-acetylase n=1 Tax=Tessaracoccus antarcticus TaxID=2479848 RepID=A0A3M0GA23_9ACTN|nr:PIG-L family deacetylase [Tessaracoccus antarcticus]RMB61744.1 GlcNAc-PI de-N-acetylase [Tessaracoccus antarcticus]